MQQKAWCLYYDKRCGSFGTASCFSFYANKLITTGEAACSWSTTTTSPSEPGACDNLAFGHPDASSTRARPFNYR